ncbi:hypothetical protein HMPREF9086_1003 [Enterobacter hormaechei ATCC 49162]|nr:hypothetical protein HMPREF9086_1003 [Enterobacter hormaechei ATCC 49162]
MPAWAATVIDNSWNCLREKTCMKMKTGFLARADHNISIKTDIMQQKMFLAGATSLLHTVMSH